MPQSDKPAPPGPRASAANGRKAKAAPSAKRPRANGDLFAFTIDAADGRIVAVERVEAGGARHDLSPEEKARLAKTPAGAPLKRLVEQAFEAGIECVLGETSKDDPTESKADRELSRILLQSLIEDSSAKHLIEAESLKRAVVEG
jgi:hypothetical protein